MNVVARDKWVSRIEWIFIAAIIVADIALSKLTGVPMEAPMRSMAALAIIIGLWPLTAILTRFFDFGRGSEIVAENASKFFTFVLIISAFEYYMAMNPAPLADGLMVDIDSMLGFNWPSYFAWTHTHPTLTKIMAYMYASLTVQAGIVLFILGISYPRRARYFVTAFLVSSLLTMVIFAAIPVAGPFVYFHHTDLPQAYYTEHYIKMRDHALAAIPMDDIRGIVSFPSFHVSSAVVLTYFFRRLGVVSILAFLLNVGMSVASLTIGGHYLIDCLAGLVVGLATISIIHMLEGKEPPIKLTKIKRRT